MTGDVAELRRVFSCFPSGIAAVCTLTDDGPAGLAASSFTTVSIDPPLVSVCIQNTSTTWPVLRGHPRIGISVLAQDHESLGRQLASKHGDRFAGVAWEATSQGAVHVHGSTAWLDCSLHAEVPAGDHLIALLEIHRMSADPAAAPLIFHASTFRRLHVVS
ncbi:flavin reductase family protein [Actinomycetospora termitidis]|uniref:flavin reductase family protein n=1 Tax=Actinomycetospora termitidis TaxID=3053470 RepID=UPI0031F30DCE